MRADLIAERGREKEEEGEKNMSAATENFGVYRLRLLRTSEFSEGKRGIDLSFYPIFTPKINIFFSYHFTLFNLFTANSNSL